MTTIPAHREFTLQVNGLDLQVRDWGPEDGSPVVFHHGTPSSSYAVPHGGSTAGARVVTFDRPGYGRSANQPGRTVADAAVWTTAIADSLGLDRFAVMGTSGGGPHAAATAALLGDRVNRLCVCVGLGPVGLEGFDEIDGMVVETHNEILASRDGEAALRNFISELMLEEDPLEAWMTQLPPSDQDVLSRSDVQAEMVLDTEESGRSGIEGWLEDDLAFFNRPWQCDVAAITANTLLVYGDADVLVPHAQGDAYLRAIGHGQLVKVPGGGHWMDDFEPGILAWLVSTDAAPATLF